MAVLRIGQGVRIAPRTVLRSRERELVYVHGQMQSFKHRQSRTENRDARVIRFPIERRLAAIDGGCDIIS